MIKKLLLAILLLHSYFGIAQSTTYFSRVYNSRALTAGHILELQDGYLLMGKGRFGTSYETVLIKLGLNGDTSWTKVYGNPPNEVFVGDMVIASDGNIVACFAWIDSATSKDDVVLSKFDSRDGTLIWEKRYVESEIEIPYAIKETSTGDYVILGLKQIPGSNNGTDMEFIKTNSIGDLLWRKQYNRTRTDIGNFIAETADGGFFLSGSTSSPNNPSEDTGYLIKIDESGNKLWDRIYYYGTSNIKGNGRLGVLKLRDGNFLLSGSFYPNDSSFDIRITYLTKITPSGAEIWRKEYSMSSYNSWAWAVPIENEDGSFVAGSWGREPGEETKYDILKVNAEGDLIWTRSYYHNPSDINHIYETIPTKDGGYIGIGSAVDTIDNIQKVWVVKLDCMGCDGIQCQSPTPCEPRPLGTADSLLSNSGFALYPNPADNQVTIEYKSTNLPTLTVYNIMGQQVHYTANLLQNGSTTIDTATLPAGVYVAVLRSTGSKPQTLRFIISR